MLFAKGMFPFFQITAAGKFCAGFEETYPKPPTHKQSDDDGNNRNEDEESCHE